MTQHRRGHAGAGRGSQMDKPGRQHIGLETSGTEEQVQFDRVRRSRTLPVIAVL